VSLKLLEERIYLQTIPNYSLTYSLELLTDTMKIHLS